MERVDEWEGLRRSMAMLPPGPRTRVLDREEAMRLLSELQTLEDRLRRLKSGLQQLITADPD